MPKVPPYRYSIGIFVHRKDGSFVPDDYDITLDVPISSPGVKARLRSSILADLKRQRPDGEVDLVTIFSWQRYEQPGPVAGTEVT